MSKTDILKEDSQAMLLPVAVVFDKVFFPHMNCTFDIPQNKSAMAFQSAQENDGLIFLTLTTNRNISLSEKNIMYCSGVVARVCEMKRNEAAGAYHVRVEVLFRAELFELMETMPYLFGRVIRRCDINFVTGTEKASMGRVIKKRALAYASIVKGLPRNFVECCCGIDDVSYLTDYVISNVFCASEVKQSFLNQLDVEKRANDLCAFLQNELNTIGLEQEIEGKLKQQLDKNQREYQLREKMNVIAKELGEDEGLRADVERYREKIKSLSLVPQSEEKLLRECSRLSKMQFSSGEAGIIRTYLDTCLDVPWSVFTKDNLDLKRAGKQLDRDHYGLEKVKKRMIEMLAVRTLAPEIKGQIICLVGPPGVGKTSIAKSVAEAMERKFVRIALGGVHDEAEIRGHRKTYLGSMPGRIASAMIQAKSMNPLILLDEIDKLGSDYKGDPASALLEVLDSEQNSTFTDHYLDIPLDLSNVLFITTANDYYSIPEPLIDRMEVIQLSSYTLEEKKNIAKKHLIRKQIKKHGLTVNQLKFTDKSITELIQGYTSEAGVRSLERKIADICRKTAAAVVEGKEEGVKVTPFNLKDFLGPRRYKKDLFSHKPAVGIANGLAWTSAGGTMLEIEVTAIKGTGKIQLTGQLGEVMKESAMAAVTFIRSKAESYGIPENFYDEYDIHIHAPEGAVPKDGPSAGVTMAVAILSALTGIPVRSDVAMTGEISLRGRVLPIGGLREKSMAAYMNGIPRVIIPKDNVADLEEISDTVKNSIVFIPAENVETVFQNTLVVMPSESNDLCEAVAASAPVVIHQEENIPLVTGEKNENGKSIL